MWETGGELSQSGSSLTKNPRSPQIKNYANRAPCGSFVLTTTARKPGAGCGIGWDLPYFPMGFPTDFPGGRSLVEDRPGGMAMGPMNPSFSWIGENPSSS